MLILAILGSSITIFYYMIELSTASFLWLVTISCAVVLFLALLVTAIKKLIIRTPAFSITDNGLVDDISLARAGIIPWNKIKSVKYEKYLNDKYIMITIQDAQKIIDALPFFKRKMVNQQYVDTGALIVVNPKMIKGKPEDIVAKIKRRARV